MVCDVKQVLKGQSVIIRVSRRVHDDFFRKVTALRIFCTSDGFILAVGAWPKG